MPTCQLIKSLLDSNEDFLDWQTPRLEKHEIDCDGPSNGRLRQNGAPDYESGGQEFESLRARQQASNATYILPIATCGLYYGLPISYQIATSVVGLILEVGPRSEPVPEICTVR